ncbi:Oidioi.mRNA.OKI2018_I69.chr1.g266.t1.cds [Oikopleura dioica]|uniref:Oidioi.mRNA.OKI2018_I69.chr1.g266.t1.cds n=1 Tax=Oikopleura dioica TaxID=34765 RepID=A0ABN7SN56_OIKDI|nr:Oidioi.mRNA.OKI2018_I69.chr1.g266.t1.cds [Oikopleura dioica]
MDKMARQGTKFTQSYSTHRCSPTRAAILTGRYPFRFGLGMDPIPTASNFGLDEREKLLPQYLQEVGYSSHIVGKWHLGYCREAYHPLSRGFDSFYGCLNGQVNYTDHLTTKALDFFDNREPVLAAQGKWTTDLFGQRTIKLLDQSDENAKFIYLAFNAPHEPTDAPETIKRIIRRAYPTVPESRVEHLAAVHHMDIWLSRIFHQSRKLERETIFIVQSRVLFFQIFSFHWQMNTLKKSDNGGAVRKYTWKSGTEEPRSCNFPFRGSKDTIFEGGTLTPTFVYSSKRKLPKRSRSQFFHVVDWLPTILSLSNYTSPLPKNLDGVDQSNLILSQENQASKRRKFIYAVFHERNKDGEYEMKYTARFGNFKFSTIVHRSVGTYECSGGFESPYIDKYIKKFHPDPSFYQSLLLNSTVRSDEPLGRDLIKAYSLYDLKTDPGELINLATPDKLTKQNIVMINRINKWAMAEIQKEVRRPLTSPSKSIIKRTKKAICKNLYNGDEFAMRLANGDIEEFHHNNTEYPKIKSIIGSKFCEDENDFKTTLLKFIKNDPKRVELQNAMLYLNEGVFH